MSMLRSAISLSTRNGGYNQSPQQETLGRRCVKLTDFDDDLVGGFKFDQAHFEDAFGDLREDWKSFGTCGIRIGQRLGVVLGCGTPYVGMSGRTDRYLKQGVADAFRTVERG